MNFDAITTPNSAFEMSSSFESINYGLRPNKTVERRLIFEALAQLSTPLRISEYRYLGFGALLFVDFVLAHRDLGINELVSIEYEKNAPRAQRNAPFGCIQVVPGESSVALVDGRIDLRSKRTIAWLDYDGVADASVINNIEVLATQLPVGSAIIVTVNAVRKNYLKENDDGTELSLQKSLQKELGALISDPLPKKSDSMNGFPPLIADVLMTHCTRTVEKARSDGIGFAPIFNFIYKDGSAPMVTIGGLIADQPIRDAVSALAPSATFADRYELELPVLTPRERLILDRLLPASTPLDADGVNKELGFRMPPSLTESYRKLYKFYPTFSETLGVS